MASLKKGQTLRLNEALTVVEGGSFESVGEISTLREVLAQLSEVDGVLGIDRPSRDDEL